MPVIDVFPAKQHLREAIRVDRPHASSLRVKRREADPYTVREMRTRPPRTVTIARSAKSPAWSRSTRSIKTIRV